MRQKIHSKLKVAKKTNWQCQLEKQKAKHLKSVMAYKMVQIIGNRTQPDYLLKSKLK